MIGVGDAGTNVADMLQAQRPEGMSFLKVNQRSEAQDPESTEIPLLHDDDHFYYDRPDEGCRYAVRESETIRKAILKQLGRK